MEEMNKVMEMLVEHMQEFKTRGQGQNSQSEEVEGLYFVNTTISGLNMESLVDTSATHSFVSERATKSLHRKPESNTGTCKVMKSTVMSMIGIVHSTPLRVGEWFGNMDLLVAPLDDHAMILGLDFLILSKASPLIHESHLVFLDEARTPSANP
jgi:predicted aspartyl protease